jgi:dihydrodipicolinate synthase/N-acetylneuraminate lyase
MLQGVNTPLVTPQGQGSCPDLGAMKELIDFAIAGGVRAICIGGTTGEFIHYSLGLRKQMLAEAVAHSRVPIIAGIAHSTLEGALELAQAAAGCGAAFLLLMPPYFFRYGQEEIREFYLRFAEGRPADLPILLYNIPAFTNEIAVETARELLSSGAFAGIKDSSGSLDAFLRLKALRSHHPFTLLVGDDKIFTEARAQGADGVISGVAGVIPELLIAIDRAVLSGAANRAQSLDRRLREFIAWLDRFPAPTAIKLALAGRGLPSGPAAVPLGPNTRRLAEQFNGWFRDWLPAVLREARG